MTDQVPEKPKSFILVTFSDVGSTFMDVQFDGVTPLQLLATSKYLEFKGNIELAQQERQRLEQEQMRHIARPSNDKIVIGSKH